MDNSKIEILVEDITKISQEEWREFRKIGIGGSDAGAICGLGGTYSSSIDVWLDKTGRGEEKEQTEGMRQGVDLEDYVAKRFEEETGKKVYNFNSMVRSKEYPFMMANVDRLVEGENSGLECKTSAREELWINGVPHNYRLQCLHYMQVMGLDKMYLAVIIYGRSFRIYEIERDEEELQMLVQLEKEFWEECVLKMQIPKPDGSEAYTESLKKLYGDNEMDKVKKITPEINKTLLERLEILSSIKLLEKEKELSEQKVRLFMEEDNKAESANFTISYKANKNGTRVLLIKEKSVDK